VKTCAAAAITDPAVVQTTVVLGLKATPLIPVVGHPADAGLVTDVIVKVVSVFLREMELSVASVNVRTPLAMTAVTLPAVLDAQLAVHVATLAASSVNPAKGNATCVNPVTTDATKLTVSVLVDPAVVVAGLIDTAAGVCATLMSAHLALAEVPTVLSFVESTLEKYPCGNVMVILPPIGMTVATVKPRVMVLLLEENLPGILSSALVNASATAVVS